LHGLTVGDHSEDLIAALDRGGSKVDVEWARGRERTPAVVTELMPHHADDRRRRLRTRQPIAANAGGDHDKAERDYAHWGVASHTPASASQETRTSPRARNK